MSQSKLRWVTGQSIERLCPRRTKYRKAKRREKIIVKKYVKNETFFCKSIVLNRHIEYSNKTKD
jgi:hypothetical protein